MDIFKPTKTVSKPQFTVSKIAVRGGRFWRHSSLFDNARVLYRNIANAVSKATDKMQLFWVLAYKLYIYKKIHLFDVGFQISVY